MHTQRCRLYSVSSHNMTPAAICAVTALRPLMSDAAQGPPSAAAAPAASSGPHKSGTTHLSNVGDRHAGRLKARGCMLSYRQIQLHLFKCRRRAGCHRHMTCSLWRTERRHEIKCSGMLQGRSPDGAAERLERRRGKEARGAAYRGVHPRPVVLP